MERESSKLFVGMEVHRNRLIWRSPTTVARWAITAALTARPAPGRAVQSAAPRPHRRRLRGAPALAPGPRR